MAQGTWQFPTGTSVNLLADYRRSPTLQLTNALLRQPNVDFATLQRTLGVDATRDLAKDVHADLEGLPRRPHAAGQSRSGSSASTSASRACPERPRPTLPAQPGTGNVYTYTLQAIGTSLTPWRDILVANGSILRGSAPRRLAGRLRLPLQPLGAADHPAHVPLLPARRTRSRTRLSRHLPGVRVDLPRSRAPVARR